MEAQPPPPPNPHNEQPIEFTARKAHQHKAHGSHGYETYKHLPSRMGVHAGRSLERLMKAFHLQRLGVAGPPAVFEPGRKPQPMCPHAGRQGRIDVTGTEFCPALILL